MTPEIVREAFADETIAVDRLLEPPNPSLEVGVVEEHRRVVRKQVHPLDDDALGLVEAVHLAQCLHDPAHRPPHVREPVPDELEPPQGLRPVPPGDGELGMIEEHGRLLRVTALRFEQDGLRLRRVAGPLQRIGVALARPPRVREPLPCRREAPDGLRPVVAFRRDLGMLQGEVHVVRNLPFALQQRLLRLERPPRPPQRRGQVRVRPGIPREPLAR